MAEKIASWRLKFLSILYNMTGFSKLYFSKYNKTTAAVCISRRALKGRKYLFRDIHNFSFSTKIQDDIFPLGTEYCCTTLWVKNSLEIAPSVTILKIFSMFIFC